MFLSFLEGVKIALGRSTLLRLRYVKIHSVSAAFAETERELFRERIGWG
jgi:hypothetical protein